MPPTPRRTLTDDDRGAGRGKKLVQTKLNFYPTEPRPLPPSGLQGRRSNISETFKSRALIREDSAEHKEWGSEGSRERKSRWRLPDPYRNAALAEISRQTVELIPSILEDVPEGNRASSLHFGENVTLAGSSCPGFVLPEGDPEAGRSGCRIQVLDGDSFDLALRMGKGVLVLNMANAEHPGGGWKKGAMAQEEELCYRSTLSHTLQKSYYPLPEISAIYSPTVVVFRTSVATGHVIFPSSRAFKTLSVISVAALRDPRLTDTDPPDYSNPEDREVMLDKVRLTLRVAAMKGHKKLVLGALGCGAFHNPREKVVECFLKVFGEPEFRGGWWAEVVFAVLDTDTSQGKGRPQGSGNFGVFYRGLNGVVV